MAGFFDWLKGKKPVSPGKESKAGIKDEEKLTEIGNVTHYFPHVKAAVIELSGTLKLKDKILIKGHTTNFEQVVTSMQINNEEISEAEKGKTVGLKVKNRVRHNDTIYKK